MAPVLAVAAAVETLVNPSPCSVGMLPVYSKIAAAFMRGVPVKEAVRRVNDMREFLPAGDRDNFKLYYTDRLWRVQHDTDRLWRAGHFGSNRKIRGKNSKHTTTLK